MNLLKIHLVTFNINNINNIKIMKEDMIINNGTDSIEPLVPEITVNDVVNSIDEPENNNKIGIFFGTIQESVTIAWRFHLKTKKHFIHVALNEYYDSALEVVDSIIEQYQGSTGIVVDNYTNSILDSGKTEVEYFQNLKSFVADNRNSNGFDDATLSTIDELIGLIDSTLYKLTAFCEKAIKSFDEFCFENYDVIGVEGGVDGIFDTITKTTKANVAPVGASSKSTKSKPCTTCECEEEEEEE